MIYLILYLVGFLVTFVLLFLDHNERNDVTIRDLFGIFLFSILWPIVIWSFIPLDLDKVIIKKRNK